MAEVSPPYDTVTAAAPPCAAVDADGRNSHPASEPIVAETVAEKAHDGEVRMPSAAARAFALVGSS